MTAERPTSEPQAHHPSAPPALGSEPRTHPSAPPAHAREPPIYPSAPPIPARERWAQTSHARAQATLTIEPRPPAVATELASELEEQASQTSELPPHSPNDQLPNMCYGIANNPPWWEAIMLGFQHYIVMLGIAVMIPGALVPQMGGGMEEQAQVIQTILFVSGWNTLLQTTLGTRLPVVIGGSFTFVAPTVSILLATRFNNIQDSKQKFNAVMRATQGALILASSIQILLGFTGLWTRVMRFLNPLSAVPMVTLVGFGLYELGFPLVAKCLEIGLPEIVILFVLAVYLPQATKLGRLQRRIVERFAVLISVAIVWLYAHFLTFGGAYSHVGPAKQLCRADRSGLIAGARWFRVPYPFQWGVPTVHAGEAFAMMVATFVALIESTGAFIAVSRSAGATMIPLPVLSRGVGWQGVGILLSGVFGTAVGSSVSIENAGLLTLTRVSSKRVVQISAAFMIFFSVFGKFGAVFASVPTTIISALYCVFFAYVGAVGLSFQQFCNVNSFRTLLIIGSSIFLGLSIPRYFKDYVRLNGYGPVHTTAVWFNDIVYLPFSSEVFVAAIVGYFLDNTLQRKDRTIRKDRGEQWWDNFRTINGDSRSEELYSIPSFNLNHWGDPRRFFPLS